MLRQTRVKDSYTPKQRAFACYLEQLGYVRDRDFRFRPSDMRIVLRDGGTVCRSYIPTFYVAPEFAMYDVDGDLTPDQERKITGACDRDGYEFHVVTEAEFPFEEYVV